MRGDVVRVRLDSSKQGKGTVQVEPRPAVILSPDATYNDFESALIVVGTSNQKATRFPHTALVQPSRENGLSNPTVFLGFQVQVVSKQRLVKQLGRLAVADLTAVEAVVRQALGL